MSVPETDLEVLESYLDDALDDEGVAALRARLAAEPELAAALAGLRTERSLREAFWSDLEPGDAEVDALVARVGREVWRRERVGRVLRPARYVAAAAACVAAGVAIGIIGFAQRGGTGAPGPVAGTQPRVDVKSVAVYEVTLRDPSGKVVAVQRFDSVEKAQEFAGDLARWQARQERLAGGQFVVRADRF